MVEVVDNSAEWVFECLEAPVPPSAIGIAPSSSSPHMDGLWDGLAAAVAALGMGGASLYDTRSRKSTPPPNTCRGEEEAAVVLLLLALLRVGW